MPSAQVAVDVPVTDDVTPAISCGLDGLEVGFRWRVGHRTLVVGLVVAVAVVVAGVAVD